MEHNEIAVPHHHIRFFVTPNFFYYGTVVSGACRIVIDPSRQAAAQDQELKDMVFQLNLTPDDVPDFLSGMKQIIRLPLERR